MSRLILSAFYQGVYAKRNEFALIGSKFFPFRVDPLSERTLCAVKQTRSHKNCLSCKNGGKSTKCIKSP